MKELKPGEWMTLKACERLDEINREFDEAIRLNREQAMRKAAIRKKAQHKRASRRA